MRRETIDGFSLAILVALFAAGIDDQLLTGIFVLTTIMLCSIATAIMEVRRGS